MSKIYVDSIASKTGAADALSIDSNGRVTNNQPIGFHCKVASAISLTSSSLTKIGNWESSQHGGWNSGIINESTGVISITKTGHYVIQADIRIDNFSGTYVYTTIRRWDGSAFVTSDILSQSLESATASDYTALNIQTLAYLESGNDYALGVGNSGDATTSINGSTYFSMWYLG